jgi:hypothetical protein
MPLKLRLGGEPRVSAWAEEPESPFIVYPLIGPPASFAFERRVEEQLAAELGHESVSVHYWIDRLLVFGASEAEASTVDKVVGEALREENERRGEAAD